MLMNNYPEKKAILILESGNKLYKLVEQTTTEYLIIHTNDINELKQRVIEIGNIPKMLILEDKTGYIDALNVYNELHSDFFFRQLFCVIITDEHDVEKERQSDALGIWDYIVIPKTIELPEIKKLVTLHIKRNIDHVFNMVTLRESASKDGLTGFINHAFARDVVTDVLNAYRNRDYAFAICDIDFFKQVNDIRGHEFGDVVLQAEADRIRAVLPPGAVPIRFGGDEFIIVAPLIDSVESFADKLFSTLCWNQDDYMISNSVGIATTVECERSWEDLFKKADQSLFISKANGRSQYHIYTKSDTGIVDGVVKDLRNSTLNLDKSSLIHSLTNAFGKVYHVDLATVAVTTLSKNADGTYGWSEPIDSVSFSQRIIENVEPSERLYLSEFINPNTLANKLMNKSEICLIYTEIGGKRYKARYIVGDRDSDNVALNALLLISEAEGNSEKDTVSTNISEIEKCLAGSLSNTYNAIWIIHPTTLERELISIQADICRHRRINNLCEGGNFWQETVGYANLYIVPEHRNEVLEKMNPDNLFKNIPEREIYAIDFDRTTDGERYHCRYGFSRGVLGSEDVIIQTYRRMYKVPN